MEEINEHLNRNDAIYNGLFTIYEYYCYIDIDSL